MGSPLAGQVLAGDKLLEELEGSAPGRQTDAPSMGRLKRCSYTHDALIDLIIKHPGMDQNHLAAAFGYTPGWISNILASDAFKARMAARREEVVDPVMRATIKERFEALAHQSLTVLMDQLSQSTVSPLVALRAAELGAKAIGIGGHAPAPVPQANRLEQLAERLLALHAGVKGRIINGEAKLLSVEAGSQGGEGSLHSDQVHGSLEGNLRVEGDATAPQ